MDKKLNWVMIFTLFMIVLSFVVSSSSRPLLSITKGAKPPVVTHKAKSSHSCSYPIHIERVKDGDTFVATIDLPWGISLRHQDVRAGDFDAWESSRRRRSVTITDEEIRKGKNVTTVVRAYLAANSESIRIQPTDRERGVYGRILGKLIVRGKPLAKWMQLHHFIRGED